MRTSRPRFPSLFSCVCCCVLLAFPATGFADQVNATPALAPEPVHRDAVWRSIAEHLPDPVTASAKMLELQADVLRARRYPDEALVFYKYALARGGDPESLANKIALTHLQLGHTVLAQVYLQQLVKTHPGNGDAWNNLGAVEYTEQNYSAAERDYKRGIKLNPKSAVFHSNLGMAYMSRKRFKPARKEFDTALQLDPDIFTDQGSGGVAAHFLSPTDQARFCFEMARTFAASGNEPEMLHWLAKAAEYGVDVMQELAKDKSLERYTKDARVVELVRIANSMNSAAKVTSNIVNTSSTAAPLESQPSAPKVP